MTGSLFEWRDIIPTISGSLSGDPWEWLEVTSGLEARQVVGWQEDGRFVGEPAGLRTGVVRRLVASLSRSWSLQGASRAERV